MPDARKRYGDRAEEVAARIVNKRRGKRKAARKGLKLYVTKGTATLGETQTR